MRWDVARELDRTHRLPHGSVFETLYRTEAWRDVERGAGDRESWLRSAHQELERRAGGPLPPLHEEWRRAQTPIEPNLALVRALRSRYRVSVLSNADRLLRERLETDGTGGLFDDIVISAEVGMAKPEPGIFRLAVERLGLAPAECVFIDDWDLNVEAAREVGFRAVLHRVDKGDDLRAQLAALDVVAGP
jgi:epoxide hydrolase-like predicted phosphatase